MILLQHTTALQLHSTAPQLYESKSFGMFTSPGFLLPHLTKESAFLPSLIPPEKLGVNAQVAGG